MRVLFSSTAGRGHVQPLVPLARAFATHGDDVAFATGAAWRDELSNEKFVFFPVGIEALEARRRLADHQRQLAELSPDLKRVEIFNHRFAVIDAPERIDDLSRLVTSWKPDLLIHESAELAAPIVAARFGLRTAHHSYGRLVQLSNFERVAQTLSPLWRAAGLEPEPLAGMFRSAYIDICPPGLAWAEPAPANLVYPLRPTIRTTGDARAALQRSADRPTIYVTLGTVFNEISLFRVLFSALEQMDADVVATLGHNNDPGDLGPVGSNIRVATFIPQSQILPSCDLVVSHAGSGSMLGALAHGKPMVLVPRGADQFDNAEACRQAGVAQVVLPDELTPDAIRTAVSHMLTDNSYLRRAQEIEKEIASMPAPDELVVTLSRFAAKRP